jgi:signal recognition particle GTPase
MSTPDGQLVRKAFLTKYGYAPDLSYPEILRQFRSRYDQAHALRLQNAGVHRVMLVIEGMAEGSLNEEATVERENRKRKVARLTEESGYGITEIDQLIERFAERLEVEWIQKV